MALNRYIAGVLLFLASSAQANEADDTIHRLVDDAHVYAIARSPAGLSRTLFEIAKVLPKASNDGLAAVSELSKYLETVNVAPGQDATPPAASSPAAPLPPPIESQPAEPSEPPAMESGAGAQQPPPVPGLPAPPLPALTSPVPFLATPASHAPASPATVLPAPAVTEPALPAVVLSVPALPSLALPAPAPPTPALAPITPALAPITPALVPPAPAPSTPVLAPPAPALASPTPVLAPPAPAQPSPAPSATAPPTTAVAPLASPALLDLLRRQGAAALANGDISGARRFFQRGADAGCAPCAEGMAQTFDAQQLSRIGAIGIRPDPVQAEVWRARARQLTQTRQP